MYVNIVHACIFFVDTKIKKLRICIKNEENFWSRQKDVEHCKNMRYCRYTAL